MGVDGALRKQVEVGRFRRLPWLLRRWWFWVVIGALLIWLTSWGLWELRRYQARLGAVPAYLHPIGIAYAKAEELGFGPGGDEYALYIFSIREDTADRIAREGLAFFHRQENVDMLVDGDQRKFSRWFPTPVLVASSGFSDPVAGTPVPLEVSQFHYGGEGVWPFPAGPPELADAMFAEPGNFYSQKDGHYAVIVVSPARRKIVYFHRRLMFLLPK